MNHMNISINDVASQWADISYCENNILDFLRSGNYMSDEPIQKFEHAYADYIDTDYAVGVSNGTDALHLCYEVLKKDKTLICISHKLSNLKNMDKIISLKNGSIDKVGNAEEMLLYLKKIQ